MQDVGGDEKPVVKKEEPKTLMEPPVAPVTSPPVQVPVPLPTPVTTKTDVISPGNPLDGRCCGFRCDTESCEDMCCLAPAHIGFCTCMKHRVDSPPEKTSTFTTFKYCHYRCQSAGCNALCSYSDSHMGPCACYQHAPGRSFESVARTVYSSDDTKSETNNTPCHNLCPVCETKVVNQNLYKYHKCDRPMHHAGMCTCPTCKAAWKPSSDITNTETKPAETAPVYMQHSYRCEVCFSMKPATDTLEVESQKKRYYICKGCINDSDWCVTCGKPFIQTGDYFYMECFACRALPNSNGTTAVPTHCATAPDTKDNTGTVFDSELSSARVDSCGMIKGEPVVLIDPEMWAKARDLMEAVSTEWLGYLFGEKTDENKYKVDSIMIPKQEVSSGSCRNLETPPANSIGIIHSHHTMFAEHSSIDDDGIDQQNGVSIVISTKGSTCTVKTPTACGGFVVRNAKMQFMMPKYDTKSFVEEAKPKLQSYTYTYSKRDDADWQNDFYGYGRYYGDNWNQYVGEGCAHNCKAEPTIAQKIIRRMARGRKASKKPITPPPPAEKK